MNNNNSNGPVVAVIVIIIVLLVGWFAYSQGFFSGRGAADSGPELQIDLGDTMPGANGGAAQ